jgi:hypothetical protein
VGSQSANQAATRRSQSHQAGPVETWDCLALTSPRPNRPLCGAISRALLPYTRPRFVAGSRQAIARARRDVTTSALSAFRVVLHTREAKYAPSAQRFAAHCPRWCATHVASSYCPLGSDRCGYPLPNLLGIVAEGRTGGPARRLQLIKQTDSPKRGYQMIAGPGSPVSRRSCRVSSLRARRHGRCHDPRYAPSSDISVVNSTNGSSWRAEPPFRADLSPCNRSAGDIAQARCRVGRTLDVADRLEWHSDWPRLR